MYATELEHKNRTKIFLKRFKFCIEKNTNNLIDFVIKKEYFQCLHAEFMENTIKLVFISVRQ